ncbi:COP9 signalosome complex subunit 4-like [Paramacrobiotus metropolitanus]|uniref:COP9 signalosome complex subunit 4-like n=1 Tax=Paramacrobiotus metropolitanus TaxID=2943436 RepID=UPI002445D3D8|nr:COP9 signalosome complex subunit 4-like [Paramacrobiotus metropolitanus]
MEQVQVFKEILNQIGSGQGTFRESGEQGRTLMDVVRQLPSSDVKGECLKSFLDVILRESFNIVSARQYLNEFVTGVNDLDAEMQKMVISYALDKMQSRSISFEEQMYPLRLRLAAELEREQNWLQAARVLSQIPLESGQKQYTKENKMELYLQIGRLFLEAEEFTEAENYIHRLGLLIDSAASEEIRISHSAAFARIQDFKRKYIEASQRYYDLSRRPTVAESERKMALSNAVNCILLAPVSSQRSRVMAVLIKDERSLELPTYAFLCKVFDGKTIKRQEIDQFAANLQPHQRDALTPDGSLLLEQTFLEHNILSTRKYFRVATFQGLSRLLDIPVAKLEKIMVNMVSEGRLHVKIDHTKGAVTFEQEHPLNGWDKKLEAICMQVNKATEMIAARHPEWYASVSADQK